MIRFKDFVPQQRAQPSFFSAADFEQLESAVERANHWIESVHVKIMNIETVLLPNIHSAREEGSKDPDLRVMDPKSYWHQVVRVWYEDDQR